MISEIDAKSRPARGAWIEIGRRPTPLTRPMSRPARGAWIEIRYRPRIRRCSHGRAPHGARGLKYKLRSLIVAPHLVAPRTGRVD